MPLISEEWACCYLVIIFVYRNIYICCSRGKHTCEHHTAAQNSPLLIFALHAESYITGLFTA